MPANTAGGSIIIYFDAEIKWELEKIILSGNKISEI